MRKKINKRKNKNNTFHRDTRTRLWFSEITSLLTSSQLWSPMALLHVCLYAGQNHFCFNLNHCFSRKQRSLGSNLFVIIMRTSVKEKSFNMKTKILCVHLEVGRSSQQSMMKIRQFTRKQQQKTQNQNKQKTSKQKNTKKFCIRF